LLTEPKPKILLAMQYGKQVLKYKHYDVFVKVTMPYFERVQKVHVEDEACFMFVNKGEFSIRSQEEYMNLNRSTALLAKCMNYFYESSEEQRKNTDCFVSTGIFIYPSLVQELFEFDLSKSNYTVDFNLKKIEVDRLLENYRNSINILLDNPELADEQMVATKLKEFILLITKSQQAPSRLDFLAALFKPNDVEFKSTIKHNLYANLSINELAALTHLSTSSFKRKFRNTFNESPKKYITKKKVEKAASLLKTSSSRISDIAYDVGFDSLATFNRNFTNTYQTSPSEYRVTQNEKSLT
jgi:AraC-like DNA-binding protein